MSSIDWQDAAAIATVLSSLAFAASAIAVVVQLRQAARASYFSVTAHLFEIWQSTEFQHDQLFLLHKLGRMTWEEFCAGGRGEHAERAIHRVGGFYDRVGNLVRHNLIRKEEILPTIGGYAVAVWDRIEPLVKELRLRENAVLFENYEALLPECHECYVPGISHSSEPTAIPAQLRPSDQPACELPARPNGVPPSASKIEIPTLVVPTIASASLTSGKALTTVDPNVKVAADLNLPDSDGIAHRLSEFTGSGLAVVVYARGAWCPFCLRQLSDYAALYGEFKRAGLEVVALSPESQRKSRRLRKGLKLPFSVLSDAKFEAARALGLMDHEKTGLPTPATLILDDQRRILLSSLNDWARSLAARDVLEYGRSVRQGDLTVPRPSELEKPKPGRFFLRGLANMALGVING